MANWWIWVLIRNRDNYFGELSSRSLNFASTFPVIVYHASINKIIRSSNWRARHLPPLRRINAYTILLRCWSMLDISCQLKCLNDIFTFQDKRGWDIGERRESQWENSIRSAHNSMFTFRCDWFPAQKICASYSWFVWYPINGGFIFLQTWIRINTRI